MLLLFHALPEREGGGGAPLECVLVRACAAQESGAGDRPAGALKGWDEAVACPEGARHKLFSIFEYLLIKGVAEGAELALA